MKMPIAMADFGWLLIQVKIESVTDEITDSILSMYIFNGQIVF